MGGISSLVSLDGLQTLTSLEHFGAQSCGITDIQPLVDNADFATGDTLDVQVNPLSSNATSVQIPALEGSPAGG